MRDPSKSAESPEAHVVVERRGAVRKTGLSAVLGTFMVNLTDSDMSQSIMYVGAVDPVAVSMDVVIPDATPNPNLNDPVTRLGFPTT